jgi:hypothetical protein
MAGRGRPPRAAWSGGAPAGGTGRVGGRAGRCGSRRQMKVRSRGGMGPRRRWRLCLWRSGTVQFFSNREGGGSSGYTTWVCAWWVRKTICFWQKHSPNYDFWYFIVLPPYPHPKIYDMWVRREGYCRMDLPGPTTSVGTRTDYSVGPWDYSGCATRHLMAWGARTQWRSTQIESYTCPVLCRELLDVPD